MYTIKEASRRTGVPIASLRAWERRYGVVEPQRGESGYRLYDDDALTALSAMRALVEEGWSPQVAAVAVRSGEATARLAESGRAATTLTGTQDRTLGEPVSRPSAGDGDLLAPEVEDLTRRFLEAAAGFDAADLDAVLDRAFALASFERVVDGWLMPTLVRLGQAWADGRVDVGGEHAASNAVSRRLAQAFAAAASVNRGPHVVVGLPTGSHHQLGALAFATALRRRGVAVVYVGADLPVASWRRAVRAFPTAAAVMAVVTAADRDVALATAEALKADRPDLLIAAGGAHSGNLEHVVSLPPSVGEAAKIVDELLPR